MRAIQEIEDTAKSGAIAALGDEMELCSTTDAKVLITTASGVDRALIARTIHDRSARSGRRFTRVNCADAAESVVEARVFGQRAGFHSAASRGRAGAIELADGGTVLLDEVGDLPPRLQGLLLGYLETGEVRRVGSVETRAVNARIIAATSRTLTDRIRSGWFREDLFYRLNLIHIVVPPVAARGDAVPVTGEHVREGLSPTVTGRRG